MAAPKEQQPQKKLSGKRTLARQTLESTAVSGHRRGSRSGNLSGIKDRASVKLVLSFLYCAIWNILATRKKGGHYDGKENTSLRCSPGEWGESH